jgi:hypothetical protein
MEAVDGVTKIDVNTTADTFRVAVPLIAPDVAVIDVDPFETPVASPPPLTVATAVAEDVQIAVLVKF